MPISADRLQKILQHNASSGLCGAKADQIIEAHKNSGNMYDDVPSVNDYNDFDDSLYLGSTLNEERTPDYTSYDTNEVSNSKLPSAIKQSLMEKQIDTSVLREKSVTEQLNLKPIARKMKQMNEAAAPQPQQTAIDYALIKTIVKSCLDEYMQQETGTLKTIGLSQGKIKLVDNKGNIFSAELEHIGNVKDKKG